MCDKLDSRFEEEYSRLEQSLCSLMQMKAHLTRNIQKWYALWKQNHYKLMVMEGRGEAYKTRHEE